MNIIIFYLKLRIKRALNWKMLLVFTILCLSLIFVDNLLKDIPLNEITIRQVTSFSIVFITLIISTSFFPFYLPRIKIFQKFFPVTSVRLHITELIINLINIKSLMIASIIVYVGRFTESTIIALTVILFAATIFVSEQTIKILYETSRLRLKAIFILLNICIGASSIITILFQNNFSLSLLAVSLLFFISVGVHLHCSRLEPQFKDSEGKAIHNKAFYWLLILKTMYKNQYIVSHTGLWLVFVKLLFLPVYFKKILNIDPSNADSLTIIILVLLTIVPLFTYIFNNLWGFLRSTFLTISTSVDVNVNLVRLYFIALTPFVVFDLIYNTTYMYISNKLTLSFLLYYFSVLLIAILIGLMSSTLKPIRIKKSINFFSFQGSTNLIANITLFGYALTSSYLYCKDPNSLVVSCVSICLAILSIGVFIKIFLFRFSRITSEKLIFN
jgi:hypothetical protein